MSAAAPPYLLGELAQRFGCTLAGPAQLSIEGVGALHPGQPGTIAFLANGRYRRHLRSSRAAAVVLRPEDAAECRLPALIHDNPYLIYAHIATLFAPPAPRPEPGRHATASVARDAWVAPSVSIAAHVTIGSEVVLAEGVLVGPGCVVERGACLGEGTVLVGMCHVGPGVTMGKRCHVHPGAVIGADGFGFARGPQGWLKIPQLGSVVLGDEVEVGANTTIDRGAIDNTELADGVKLDNQVQIGHNVRIGKDTVIAGCTGVAGSTIIGARCLIGGAVAIGGHLEIADDVMITGMSMVTHSLRHPGTYSSGIAAAPNQVWRRNAAAFAHLDELRREVRRMRRGRLHEQG